MRTLLAALTLAATVACNDNPCALEPCPPHVCPADICLPGYHACGAFSSPHGISATCSPDPCDEFAADVCDL